MWKERKYYFRTNCDTLPVQLQQTAKIHSCKIFRFMVPNSDSLFFKSLNQHIDEKFYNICITPENRDRMKKKIPVKIKKRRNGTCDQKHERLTVVGLFHLASICRLRKIVRGQPNMKNQSSTACDTFSIHNIGAYFGCWDQYSHVLASDTRSSSAAEHTQQPESGFSLNKHTHMILYANTFVERFELWQD